MCVLVCVLCVCEVGEGVHIRYSARVVGNNKKLFNYAHYPKKMYKDIYYGVWSCFVNPLPV